MADMVDVQYNFFNQYAFLWTSTKLIGNNYSDPESNAYTIAIFGESLSLDETCINAEKCLWDSYKSVRCVADLNIPLPPKNPNKYEPVFVLKPRI